ncbi:hypothetical protein [Enterobacter sp.]|uniref:hypothetical protein n=1 Tax=Enterobacter sp. TaxID=42895 RepID=UPI002901072F|nr:hypothetical protein [Enterobacter sp.]MDU1921220.1 hypothetical protein [Enterobacter sp.]
MTKFTKERLISEIEMLEHFAGNVKWISEKGEQSLLFAADAMRQLLDGMDQEPVADVVTWSSPNEERTCDIRWRRHDVEPGPLYAVPQLAVPDAISTRQAISKMEDCEPCDSINVAYKYGWNACRAAMLHGDK